MSFIFFDFLKKKVGNLKNLAFQKIFLLDHWICCVKAIKLAEVIGAFSTTPYSYIFPPYTRHNLPFLPVIVDLWK